MADYRVFHPPVDGNLAELRLSASESHHLVVVNRARRGDAVVAFDGAGCEWACTLAEEGRREAVLLVNSTQWAVERLVPCTLLQAIPKGGVMEHIVRQATEIGVARLVPVLSERCQVQLDESRGEKKLEKWRMTALEAAKQCGNPWLPEILPPLGWAEALAWVAGATGDTAGYGGAGAVNAGAGGALNVKLLASLHPGARTLRDVLDEVVGRRAGSMGTAGGAEAVGGVNSSPTLRAGWLIGPEGDFSPGELAQATAAGFSPVTLGPLVLRCDTAAAYALSILSYEWQCRAGRVR